jgi:hypothetical protein
MLLYLTITQLHMSSCFLFSLPAAIRIRTKGSRGPLAQTAFHLIGSSGLPARRTAKSWVVGNSETGQAAPGWGIRHPAKSQEGRNRGIPRFAKCAKHGAPRSVLGPRKPGPPAFGAQSSCYGYQLECHWVLWLGFTFDSSSWASASRCRKRSTRAYVSTVCTVSRSFRPRAFVRMSKARRRSGAAS